MSEEPPVHGRITNKAGKSDKPRYIRPVERQRMRPWLISHLDGDDIPGLEWQDRKEKVFRISWKHAANQCFNMQKDTNLFERWAIHTGRHFDSDHKRWKANFRCALNSLPDVQEHKDEGIKKGNNAFKVYRFLDEKETRVNKELKGRKKKEPPDGDTEEDKGYRDHSYAGSDQMVATDIPRLEHFSGGLRFMDTFQTQKFRPLQGRPDDPNLQEILAAATASLAAGSDAVSLEKISIEQLSRLGELSRMRLEIRQSSPDADGHMDVYLCTWCDKVFPSKIEIFKHLLMTHQARLLSGEVYKPAEGPDVSDPKYQKLQKEIEVLEKEVFSFKPESYQATGDEVENEEIVDVTSAPDAESQALDLSLKSKGNQPAKQEVALDLSMSSLKRHKSAKTLQAKQTSKKRRSSLEIDYTVKFGNYGLAGMPRTKRQMSLHTRKKEEEEEKLAKKQSADVDNVEGGSQRSAEDLVHAEILMSLQSAPDDVDTSNDSTSVKIKKETGKTKKGKASQKKHIVNMEKVIDDVAKRGKGDSDRSGDEGEKGTLGNSKFSLTAFRCGLCLRKFDDATVLNRHVEEHKQVEKASPIIRLKPDPIISADNPGFMYFRQKTAGNVQTIWKCQISSSSGATSVYVCGVCQMKFDSLAAINEHEKIHAVKSENQDDPETGSEVTAEPKMDMDATDQSKIEHMKEKDKTVETDERDADKGNKEMCEESEDIERMETNIEDTGDDKGVDQEVITVVKVTGDSIEETDSGDTVETEAVIVTQNKQEEMVVAGEHIEEVMDTSEVVEVITESVTAEELQGGNITGATDKQEGADGTGETDETHDQRISEIDSEKKSQVKELGKDLAEEIKDDNQVKAVNEVNNMDTQEGKGDVKEDTVTDGTDEKDCSEKAKVVQCNVPAFLEVSEAAEGYGIKEEEVSEDSDKKTTGMEYLNCGICNKKLKLDEVKVHLDNHDAELEQSGKLSDSCIICKKMIPSKDMNEHLKSHSVLELSLAKNILVHNQNQLKKQLVVHKQLVKEAEAKGENIKMFVCNLCDKGFEDCGSLSEHVEKHLSSDDDTGKCEDVLEDEGCVDAVPEADAETDQDPKPKKRKLKTKPETDQANKPSKKSRIIGRNTNKVTDSEPVKDNTATTKPTVPAVIESDPKKNSLLAAALSSAPKFAATLPKPVTTTETIVTPETTASNPPTVIDASIPSSSESFVVAESTSTAISTSTESVTTTTTPTSTVTSSSSSDQRTSSSSEPDNSALKDSLCLKFPLVLLKPNSDSEANRTEGTMNLATPSKQNMSLPVVLVRQENQELKLVPMSSVLNLCSTGKATEGSTNFLKLASPAVSTCATTKKTLETSHKPVTVTRPPILYAPVPSGKSAGGIQTLTASKISGAASPFPLNMFANNSVLGMFSGKPMEQAVMAQKKQVETVVTVPDSKPGGLPSGTVTAVSVGSKTLGLKDGKTESQNIIAKLLDSKGKLAAQKVPALIVTGKVNKESVEGKLKSVKPETVDQGTQSVMKSDPLSLSGRNSGAGPRPLKLGTSEQSSRPVKLGTSDQTGRPVKLGTSEQTGSGSLPHQPVLIFKRCPTSTPPTATPTDSSLLTKLPVPNDTSTSLTSSVATERNAAQEVPTKLGRPPIHGNKAVFIHSQQVSMATKPKISSSVTTVAASMKTVPSTEFSSASSTLVSLASKKQQSTTAASITTTVSSGIQLPPTVSSGVQLQPIVSSGVQLQSTVSSGVQLPPTVSSSVQLQPNLVSMMIQQLLLSQASQGPVTSTPTVTSPKPTFNLVFAQQSTAAQTSVPSTASPAPSTVLTVPQPAVSTPTVTTSQSQNLILMCKACNQSLDSIDLMGSHVCPKSSTASPTTPATTPATTPSHHTSSTLATTPSKRKITLYKCSFCGDVTFTDYSLYAQHVKSHMDKVQKGNSRSPLLACPLCRDIFQEEESVTSHMEEKHPEGNIKCKYCDRTCVGKTDYELHVLYDHPWQCNKCFHRFSTLSQLYIHVMLDFKSVPAFTCNKCNRCFPSVESIVTHTSSAHPDSDSALSYMSQEAMNSYMQKSKSTCSCTCKVCDAGFENTEYMMSHVQMVHFTKVIFMCGICGENKRLPTRSALKAHPHFSGSWKREIQFCYQCCLLFPNKSQFNKHLATHQNVVTDSTKSKLKSVLKDKAKGSETDVARNCSDDMETTVHDMEQRDDEGNSTETLESNDNTLETSDKTLETSDKTLETSDKTLETNDKTLETSDKTLKTNDKTLETSDNTLETSDEILVTNVFSLETNYITLETSDNTLEINDKTLEISDNTLETNGKRDAPEGASLLPLVSNVAMVTGVKTEIDKHEAMETQNEDVDKNIETTCDSKIGVGGEGMADSEVEGYVCEDCSTGPFRSRYQLRHHRVIKHLYPRSRTTTSYYQHVIENLKKPKGFECSQCTRRFDRQTCLFRHQLSHGPKKYQCQLIGCRSMFTSMHAARVHQRKCRADLMRNEAGTIKIEFKGIGMEGSNMGEAGGKPGNFANVYLCKLCEKDCENMSELKQHILLDHRPELYQCGTCYAYFIIKEDLTAHMNSQHYEYNEADIELSTAVTEPCTEIVNTRNLYSCSICLASFVQLKMLKKHLQKHNQIVQTARDQASGTGVKVETTRDQDLGTGVKVETTRDQDLGTGVKVETTRDQDLGTEVKVETTRDQDLGTGVKAEITVANDGAKAGAGDRNDKHGEEQECQYMCTVCKRVFRTSGGLLTHVKKHLRQMSRLEDEGQDPLTGRTSDSRTGNGELEEGPDSNKVLNAVICNICTKIVYFEENRLCESVLNHNCAVPE